MGSIAAAAAVADDDDAFEAWSCLSCLLCLFFLLAKNLWAFYRSRWRSRQGGMRNWHHHPVDDFIIVNNAGCFVCRVCSRGREYKFRNMLVRHLNEHHRAVLNERALQMNYDFFPQQRIIISQGVGTPPELTCAPCGYSSSDQKHIRDHAPKCPHPHPL